MEELVRKLKGLYATNVLTLQIPEGQYLFKIYKVYLETDRYSIKEFDGLYDNRSLLSVPEFTSVTPSRDITEFRNLLVLLAEAA
mgnify:CR=1 FL=1